MEHAVDLRLAGPPGEARAALDALAHEIERHPRAGAVLHLTADERSAPSLVLEIAVRPDPMTRRELPPVPLAGPPDAAAHEAVRFLEQWGFIACRDEASSRAA